MSQRQDGAIRWADGGHFAVVPEWILYAAISDRAVRLWGVLARHADKDTFEGTPRRKQLAEQLRCSSSTMDAAMRELRGIGAVSIEAQFGGDGQQRANAYLLHVALPGTREPPTEPPVAPPTEPPVPNKSESQIVEREGSYEPSRGREEPPPIVKVAGRNEPLDALMEECGVDPGNRQRVRWAVAALNGRAGEQGIRHLFWLEACRHVEERPELGARLEQVRASPEDFAQSLAVAIRRKAGRYREQMGGARLTPTALRNWWLDLEKQRGRGGGMTREEMLSFRV